MKGNVGEVVLSFQELEDYRWESSWSRTEFLEGFQKRVEHISKCNIALSEEYLGLRLLQASNLSKLGGTLVSIRCKSLQYSDVRSLIVDMFQDPVDSTKHLPPEPSPTICAATTNNSKARGWTEDGIQENRVKSKLIKHKTKPNTNKHPGPCKSKNDKIESNIKHSDVLENTVNFVNTMRHGKNPQNENGVFSKCVECRANTHWVRDCPDNSVQHVNMDPSVLKTLNTEAKCDAVISSDVSSTVCGWEWLTSYLDSLSPSVKSQIKWSENSRIFSFRKAGDCTSTHTIDIPMRFGRREDWNTVTTHVIDRPVPLLLSRQSLKWGKMRINGLTNAATMYGQVVKLHVSSPGYLTLPLYSLCSGAQPGLYYKPD